MFNVEILAPLVKNKFSRYTQIELGMLIGKIKWNESNFWDWI